MKHTLSILVENKPGVLTRVAGLFARRGFNIESLAVGLSEDPRFSRITIVIDGDEHPVDQVTKQLHKLINVLKIRDLDPANQVSAELLLVRVAGEGEKRTEALQIAEIFNAKIVDVDRRAAHAARGRHQRQARGAAGAPAAARGARGRAHRHDRHGARAGLGLRAARPGRRPGRGRPDGDGWVRRRRGHVVSR